MSDKKEFQFNFRNYPVIVTPPVTWRWPKLLTPGKKYKQEVLEYVSDFLMPAEEAQAWIEKSIKPVLDQAWNEFVSDERNKKKVKLYQLVTPGKPEVDEEGELTGMVKFTVKTNAIRTDRKTGKETEVQIPLWDSKGVRIPHGSVNPYGGTVGRFKIALKPYEMPAKQQVGLSFGLREAQIVKLVEGGEQQPTGFDAVDGAEGYQAAQEPSFDGARGEHADDDQDAGAF